MHSAILAVTLVMLSTAAADNMAQTSTTSAVTNSKSQVSGSANTFPPTGTGVAICIPTPATSVITAKHCTTSTEANVASDPQVKAALPATSKDAIPRPCKSSPDTKTQYDIGELPMVEGVGTERSELNDKRCSTGK